MDGSAVGLRTDSKPKALIFDADDTLWDDQVFYDKAIDRFKALMGGLGFDAEYARTKLDERELDSVKKSGFSAMSFPVSMVETYRLLCREIGALPDADVEADVYRVGAAVFTEQRSFYPGVEKMLQELKDSGYTMVLLTAGDKGVQEQKINSLALDRFFRVIRIVESKNVEVYSELMSDMSIAQGGAFMVGNSMRSDILPALEAGLYAIYVPRSTWAYEKSDDEARLQKFEGRYHVVKSTPEVIEVLQSSPEMKAPTRSKC